MNKTLNDIKDLINKADCILIGAGSGLSSSAGFDKENIFAYFVQDENWYKQNKRYSEFLDRNKNKNVLLLEFGVGFNTPRIIRFPFEQMILENKNWTLVRFNKDTRSFYDLEDRFIEIQEDIKKVMEEKEN